MIEKFYYSTLTIWMSLLYHYASVGLLNSNLLVFEYILKSYKQIKKDQVATVISKKWIKRKKSIEHQIQMQNPNTTQTFVKMSIRIRCKREGKKLL